MKSRKAVIWLLLSVTGFLVSSGSVLFMNVPYYQREKNTLIAFSAVFFLGLAFGMIASLLAAGSMKTEMKKQRRLKEWHAKHIGFFSFGATGLGLTADLVFMFAVIAMVVMWVLHHQLDYLNYVLIGVILFSLSMHGVLNGRTYYFLRKGQ